MQVERERVLRNFIRVADGRVTRRNLPGSGGQPGENQANTAYALRGKAGDLRTLRYQMGLRRIS